MIKVIATRFDALVIGDVLPSIYAAKEAKAYGHITKTDDGEFYSDIANESLTVTSVDPHMTHTTIEVKDGLGGTRVRTFYAGKIYKIADNEVVHPSGVKASEYVPSLIASVPDTEFTLEVQSIHAHVETRSADCDGSYSRDYVSRPIDGQDEYDFRDHMVTMTVSAHAASGNLTITNGDLDWHEDTEEGYSAATVTFCYDNCPDLSSQRDHRAESMGY